ncbi:hypothetical protein R6Q59_019946 [Mikania micrantha]
MSARSPFSIISSCHLCLLVILASFYLCLSKQNSDQVVCLESERQALLHFKHGLIDEAHRLASWVDDDKDCCRWEGIACDNSTGHVHRIHLRGPCLPNSEYFTDQSLEEEAEKKMLKGNISRSLLGLKQLKHLDLSSNDFREIQVPKFIGSLQNLRYLNLSNSNFSGVIPPQLGNLSKLHVLCLGKFQQDAPSFEPTSMVNMHWLPSLRLLHHLDLSGVDLSEANDHWLHVINNLHSLVELHLSACSLTKTRLYVHQLNLTSLSLLDLSYNFFETPVPEWLFSITSLVSLDISWSFYGNIISSSIHSFRNLTSLKFLHVGANDFMNSSVVLKELSDSNLITLDISYCGISSSHLNSLYNLTNLLSLDLSINQLTHRIPKSLGNHCNLRMVDLSYNKIGNISLAYLLESFLECKSPALESLSLSKNNIVGIIPHSIGEISFLRELDLAHNQLNGSIPSSLGQLTKLAYLDLSHNLLTGMVTESHFAKLVNMKHLYGTGNNLTLRPPAANWTPPFQLQRLDINSWVLGPQFPSWLQSQKHLVHLDISNTKISSPMPESFVRSFPNLIYLNISHNHIQGMLTLVDIPPTLEVVDISFNKFWGSLHKFLCSNGVKDTQELILGNNLLSGAIPECWEKWPGLVILNLENNNMSGDIPKTLGSMSFLQILNMRGNKISGRVPTSLMHLTRLSVLQLGNNDLVGNIPIFFGKFTSLNLLNLRSNNFNGNIPHDLCYLIYMLVLDLSHNNLSGNIPRCFSNYSYFSGLEKNYVVSNFFYNEISGWKRYVVSDSLVMKGREDTYNTILRLVKLLDLSNNNLVGKIPSKLMSLHELRSLNLSRNNLIGRIPDSIGDMKALESFDISLNNLSGELPTSLSRLNFLSSFNVSYNNFTGRIPVCTQLQSLNESSFLGNKLCGDPLTNSCVSVEVPIDTKSDKKEDDGQDWGLIISIAIGFVTGFWIIMAPLIMSISWRIAYFRLLGRLIKVYDL